MTGPMAAHGREAMGTMGTAMGKGMVRMGLPRAAMAHARPISLPMPSHVSAMVEAIRSHGSPHGKGMGRHGDSMGIHGQGHGDGMGSHGPAHGPRILIHCHAGLGRSPAMAVVALMAMGLDARTAVEAVAMAVPEASPNRLIFRHAEAILGEAIVVHAQWAWL